MKNNYSTYFADWMEGKLSDEEIKSLIPEKELLAFKKINKTFDTIKELNAPMDAVLSKIKAQIHAENKKTKVMNINYKWVASIAALFLIYFGISNFLFTSDVTILSNYGEQKTIALLDNSEVLLNAKSTIKYNKSSWKNKRELFLKGEAYFKVTKGSTFKVDTKNGSVTVLGTHFNVKSRGNYFEVFCYEGKVKVIHNTKTYILTPGKGVKIDRNQNVLLTGNTNEPSWVNGTSDFSKVKLKLVIDELENQFNIKFDRKNIDENKKFTGSFDNKRLNLALASVFKTMGIHYKKEKNTIILNN